MPPDIALLEARHVGRRHPQREGWLLEDVSLKIGAGRRLAVVGPSGSGKTLLLRALGLLDPLDGGEIRWQGRPIRADQIPVFRRQAIYLHQRPAFAEETVEAALRRPFLLKAHRHRRFDRDRIVRWLGQLGREESFLDKLIRDLSGGEGQIAAFLRAIQLDPVLLLLDEPTAALDANTTRAVEELLEDWLSQSADARAVIWVSHDVEQAQRVADRILSMRAGRLVEESDT